jgi:hypothetical protein
MEQELIEVINDSSASGCNLTSTAVAWQDLDKISHTRPATAALQDEME